MLRCTWLRQVVFGLGCLWVAQASLASQASGVEALSGFIAHVQSAKAQFVQKVKEPPRQDRPQRVKTASGELAFIRPERMRLHYQKPYEQLMLADGREFWLYDPDLQQVVVRPQAQPLSASALGAIAAVNSLQALQATYRVQELPHAQGLAWVLLTPLKAETSVQDIRLGWQDQTLVRMHLSDAMGQQTEWELTQWQINLRLPSEGFKFVPPPGVDLVRSR